MTEPQQFLAAYYKGWDGYQEHLVRVTAPLAPEHLRLRAAPHLRSVGEQLTHIIAVRARWLHLDLHEGGAELSALAIWDGGRTETASEMLAVRSAGELVTGLETTWQVIQDALQRWTIADFEELFPSPFPGEDDFTRQYVVWHLIEHDLHHGGELSFVLSLHGLTAMPL